MKDFFSDMSMGNNDISIYDCNSVNESTVSDSEDSGGTTSIPVTPETAIVMGVIEITKESIKCFTEYAKCREHEITERKRINATLKAIQYQIDAQKEVYIKELEKHFEERNRLYDMAEIAQKRALELGDKEMLQMCYNLILNVYTKPVGNTGQIPSMLNGNISLALEGGK